MASESGKKNWRTGEGLTTKDRLVRAGAIPLIAIAALTACSNTEAKPQPAPTSISTETPAPTDSPSTEPTGPDAEPTDTPTPGEFEGIPSGLEVDYDAFADWENITSSTIPGGSSLEEDRYDYGAKYSKRSICYNFFESNGLQIPVENGYERDSNGERLEENPEEFITSMVDRQNMVRRLAADASDPRNLEVAIAITECLTSPDKPAREALIAELEGLNDGSVPLSILTVKDVETLQRAEEGKANQYEIGVYTVVDQNGIESRIRQHFEGRTSGSGMYRSIVYNTIEG